MKLINKAETLEELVERGVTVNFDLTDLMLLGTELQLVCRVMGQGPELKKFMDLVRKGYGTLQSSVEGALGREGTIELCEKASGVLTGELTPTVEAMKAAITLKTIAEVTRAADESKE